MRETKAVRIERALRNFSGGRTEIFQCTPEARRLTAEAQQVYEENSDVSFEHAGIKARLHIINSILRKKA